MALAQPDRRHELTLLGEEPGSLRMWLYSNVTFTEWYGRATIAAARVVRSCTHRAMEHNRGLLLSNIHLVESVAQLPDAETREELARNVRELMSSTACAAVLIRGSGFRASALRGVVTGLSVIASKRSSDMRAFASVDALLEWFPAEHRVRTGVHIDAATLRSTLDQLGSAGS